MREIEAEETRRSTEAERARIAGQADAIRDRCRTLAGFLREAWHVLEPDQPYVHSWHIDAIAEHLQAVTDGRINRLVINVPPGSSKSLITSVAWPAWEWGPRGRRSERYLATSFNEGPVKRDTRKMRDLIVSPWFQSLWPEVQLVRTGETSFANSSTGTREGVAFGSLTSQRGSRLILDDPHSVDTAESDADRVKTTRRFRESVQNRLNDQERSAIVVIMQRLHQNDISGVISDLRMDYEKLVLPMEFEPARACCTSIGFCDPRSYDGELLDPVRFPRSTVEALKRDMGSHAWAGQYQQRPSPRQGGMFKLAWFGADRLLNSAPPDTEWVRHWDLAASKRSNSAFTAGVKMGRMPDGRFVISHVARFQEEGNQVRRLIKVVAAHDGDDCMISLPQDPGQAGKVQAQDLVSMLAGYDVHADPETGDKETRAEPFAAQCEAGNVYLVRGAWNQTLIDELIAFPSGKFKDQVDACSGAFGRLVMSDGGGRVGMFAVKAY